MNDGDGEKFYWLESPKARDFFGEKLDWFIEKCGKGWVLNEIRQKIHIESVTNHEYAMTEASRPIPDPDFWKIIENNVEDAFGRIPESNETNFWSQYQELVPQADAYAIGYAKTGMYRELDPGFCVLYDAIDWETMKVTLPAQHMANHGLFVFIRSRKFLHFFWHWELTLKDDWYFPETLLDTFQLRSGKPTDYVSVIWNRPLEQNEFLLFVENEKPDPWRALAVNMSFQEREQFEIKKDEGEEIKAKKRRVDGGKKSGVHPELKVLIVKWFARRMEDGEGLSAAYREFERKWKSDELYDEWHHTPDSHAIILVARDANDKGQKIPNEGTIRRWLKQ